ncbi:MAG: F0F1 ATP synthase subunit A [Ktedonobacteraceae bacterium]|nr:F0F1 ATP synthase subunit A [Ktedonobacteraceae bacterium]
MQFLWRLPEIKMAPDVIIPLSFLPNGWGITNTLFCTWISIVVLILLFYFGSRRRDLIPSGIQNLMEWAVEMLRNLVESVAGKKNGRIFFPLVASFFVFIFVSNLLDIVPGVDTIGAINTAGIRALHTSSQPVLGFLLFGDISNQITPWIRPATSDINLTMAMALISVIMTQVFGFALMGPKHHLSRFLNFTGPIQFLVGILEFISELTRIISLAFRLFGNIFAGSIVLAIFAFLLPFVGALIFIPFELFVAFIQAFIFTLLTLVFMQIAASSHDGHEEAEPISEHEAREQFAENEARHVEVAR